MIFGYAEAIVGSIVQTNVSIKIDGVNGKRKCSDNFEQCSECSCHKWKNLNKSEVLTIVSWKKVRMVPANTKYKKSTFM